MLIDVIAIEIKNAAKTNTVVTEGKKMTKKIILQKVALKAKNIVAKMIAKEAVAANVLVGTTVMRRRKAIVVALTPVQSPQKTEADHLQIQDLLKY